MNDRVILNRFARNEFRNHLVHAKTKRGRLDGRFIHRNDLGDKGAATEALYAALEVTPLWLKLWRNAAARLPPKGKAVLQALKQDWRSRPAAKIAGVSQPTVDSWKTIFKVRFAQCYQAYRRDFAR